MKRNKLTAIIVILIAIVLALTACTASASGKKESKSKATEESLAMEAAQKLAEYIEEHGELPENYITKKEAKARGWKSTYRCVSDLGEGICVCDYFGNYEEQLPVVKGRKYYEADCYYQGGPRNGYRLIYSTDGHYWFTGDHYETFVEIYPTKAIQN